MKKIIVRKKIKNRIIPIIIVLCILILFILFYLSGVKTNDTLMILLGK